MKRTLLLLMMLYSAYAFCGCYNQGQLTLNGKLIYWMGLDSPNIPIDSFNYLKDTIYINPNDSNVIEGDFASVKYNDTFITVTTESQILITDTGLYHFYGYYNQDGGCEADFSFEIQYNQTLNVVNVPNDLKLKILDNPVNNSLQFTSGQPLDELEIYDEVGRLQLQAKLSSSIGNLYETNIESLAKGIYYVEVLSAGNKKQMIKIAKY